MQGVGEEEAVAWLMSLLLHTKQHSPNLSVCLVSLLLLAIVSFYFYYGKYNSKLPPGSMGLPLIGETFQFAYFNTCPMGSPPPFLSYRLRKYGTVFKTRLMGCGPTLVSMDPELNKFLLSNEEKLVRVNFPDPVKSISGPLLQLHGARHRRFRELAIFFLSPVAIQQMHIIPIQECTRSRLRAWLHKPIIDAQHEARKFTFTYMAKRFLSLAPEDPYTDLLMRDYLYLMSGYTSVPVDLPGTTWNKILKVRKRVITTLGGLVQARKKIGQAEPEDCLDMLLKEKDECGKPFSEQEIVDLVFFFLLGGYETSSVLLTCIMKFLSDNAHVVDELRKEHTLIRSKRKANEMIDWDDFKEMNFTEHVIKESLRMGSIAHYVIRESIQDITFKDMVIPKGWNILVNFSMVHLSPSHFKDPLKFDPWRWEDTKNNNQALLMPFGGGIRSCLGSVFTKFEAAIFVHYLVTSYKWERIVPSDGYIDEVSTLSFPVIKNGILIKVEPIDNFSCK